MITVYHREEMMLVELLRNKYLEHFESMGGSGSTKSKAQIEQTIANDLNSRINQPKFSGTNVKHKIKVMKKKGIYHLESLAV